MKKIIQILLFLSFSISFGQENCENFDDDTGNWRAIGNGTTITSTMHSWVTGNDSTSDGTAFMRGNDGFGNSLIVNHNNDYKGDLGAGLGSCFCWDFKVFHDGYKTESRMIHPKLTIYNGSFNNPDLSATFTSSIVITENSGWVRVCATPILPSSNTMPQDENGKWEMNGDGNVSDWNELIADVAGVSFRVDVAGSPLIREVIGIDNFCLSTCCPDSISSQFNIDGYNCHDGVYDVRVTAQDTIPSQWWRVYETSIEGQTGGDVTIGPASIVHGGVTTIFTNLDPNKFYYIKHGVWVDGCFEWQETRTPLNRDCCIDNPQIIPFCNPEDVCSLEGWPIRVVDEDGNPVTGANGVQFSWVSSKGTTSVSDVVDTVGFEEWTLTLTYPDGCIYVRTYKKECCDENIHIVYYSCPGCPKQDDVKTLEKQIETNGSKLSDELHSKYLDVIAKQKESKSGIATNYDPCKDGVVNMRVVDDNGNLVTNFISITWSDGLYPNINSRAGIVNVTYTITVVVPANNGNDTCTYTDTFIYECPCDLPAPTNVHLQRGRYLFWDPVPGAVGYIVSSSLEWDRTCTCRYPVSLRPIETRNHYTLLPSTANGRCFMVRVAAICADGSISPYSQDICVGGDRIGRTDGTFTSAKQIKEVSITPNPTRGKVTFNVTTNTNTEVTIEIYDTYGTLIKSFVQQVVSDKSSAVSWDGSNLRKGVYFVNFRTKEETIHKQVIVK